MKTASEWFAEYEISHQNPINKRIHYVCVPAIMWSILGLLWNVHLSTINGATALATLAMVYFFTLSRSLGYGLGVVFVTMGVLCAVLKSHLPFPLYYLASGVFVIAWIGQFVGHSIEGKKPSFLKDIQFLLIGPMWVLAKLYSKIGIKY